MSPLIGDLYRNIKPHYFLEFEKMDKFELFKTKYSSTVSSFKFGPPIRTLYGRVRHMTF